MRTSCPRSHYLVNLMHINLISFFPNIIKSHQITSNESALNMELDGIQIYSIVFYCILLYSIVFIWKLSYSICCRIKSKKVRHFANATELGRIKSKGTILLDLT